MTDDRHTQAVKYSKPSTLRNTIKKMERKLNIGITGMRRLLQKQDKVFIEEKEKNIYKIYNMLLTMIICRCLPTTVPKTVYVV